MEMELGKLFIGGISWDTNEDRLREYFQTFGEVSEAVIMKDRATGRARGFGFVVFLDPAVAEMVVMQKHTINGRTVEAKKAVPRDDQNVLSKNNGGGGSIHGSPGPVRTKKIFVGGLASSVTEADFKSYFEQFGTIIDVVVMYDHNTQRPRGFGFITYDSEEAVDRVLQKTFHELNGKMVEVKRAVPKEMSPGPSRNQLSPYNYGPGRISSILMQGYNPSPIGGYGRYGPVTVGRAGFSSMGSDYGMKLNFEPNMSSNYLGSPNPGTNLSYGRVWNPSCNGNINRHGAPVGYSNGNGENGSTGWNLWGDGGFTYAASSSMPNGFMGSDNGNLGLGSSSGVRAFRDVSSPGPAAYAGGGNLDDFSIGSGVGLAKNYRTNNVHGGYEETCFNVNENGSIYEDSTWPPSRLEGSNQLGFGTGNGSSDVIPKDAGTYVGGYSVTNRQANRGIAA